MSDTPRTDVAEHNMGSVFSRHLERELVAARAELAEAVTKERERCAKVCEARAGHNSMGAYQILMSAADAIRYGRNNDQDL